MPIRLFENRNGGPVSITIARVDPDILPGRIAIITTALRQIITGPRGSGCANERAGGGADSRAGNRTARPARQNATEDAADHRAANGA
jgi:hypothetical protein